MIYKNNKFYDEYIYKLAFWIDFENIVKQLENQLREASYQSRFYAFLDETITEILTDKEGQVKGLYLVIDDYNLYLSLDEEEITIYSVNCEYKQKKKLTDNFNSTLLSYVVSYAYDRVYPEKRKSNYSEAYGC